MNKEEKRIVQQELFRQFREELRAATVQYKQDIEDGILLSRPEGSFLEEL
jgi:hypothetical protein